MSPSDTEKQEFERNFEKVYYEKLPDFTAHVNIALVGKVSSGKSSILNALFYCTRENPIAEVGARSGITTKIIPYKFEDDVLIIDCPGLDDLKKENNDQTKDFLSSIDLGIFVVTGSADAAQKANYDTLRSKSKNSVVVLNKVDEWDNLTDQARFEVVAQWKIALGVERVFETVTKGYDPGMRATAQMDIRGVNELRDHLLNFLKKDKKDILLARYLKSKDEYANSIIATTLLVVAGEAFIPGSAFYITATQLAAITSLNFLYTGEILDKSSVFRLLPSFAGESVGTTAFLWAKSFLPPTIVLDIAAAGIAVLITFAMLAAVKWFLQSGNPLKAGEDLKQAFRFFKNVGDELKRTPLSTLKSPGVLMGLIEKFLDQRPQIKP